MPFTLANEEIPGFLAKLHTTLIEKALDLGAENRAHNGKSREDAVQDVITEVSAYLIAGFALKPFKKRNIVIETRNDLTRYACRRLKVLFGSAAKSAQRGSHWIKARPDDVARATTATETPVEHPIYDAAFLLALLEDLERDAIAYGYVVVVIRSEVMAGTDDLNPCDNTAIAAILGCEPSDVRNARKRIHTLKNRHLAKRLGDDSEDTSND
jgi:hypothetical protein